MEKSKEENKPTNKKRQEKIDLCGYDFEEFVEDILQVKPDKLEPEKSKNEIKSKRQAK
ncbi:MAG TPA: hypothetical protein VF596_16240 [Pyrinomonadaceae bacterium]|jgi:hypothetical protein